MPRLNHGSVTTNATTYVAIASGDTGGRRPIIFNGTINVRVLIKDSAPDTVANETSYFSIGATASVHSMCVDPARVYAGGAVGTFNWIEAAS